MRWMMSYSTMVWLVIAAAAGILAFCGDVRGAESGKDEPAVVSADFGKWVDFPLVKTKFGAYNSGYVPGYLNTYKRDMTSLEEVRPDSLRFDGGLGSPPHIIFGNPPMVHGKPGELHFDFREADELVDLLNAHNIAPYWCYSYVPHPLVKKGQSFRHVPTDLTAWAKVAAAVAEHFRVTNRPIAYHEIYNEPDNRDFFAGTLGDYLGMYEHAAKAIREVDPDARIGGPSLAFTDSWVAPFLDEVVSKDLPLDFFSFHYYPGVPYSATNVQGVLDMILRELGKRPGLATTEVHLNEYNALTIDYPKDGPQQKHGLAASLLSDFGHFASQPGLTKVHWAQFMDTGGGNWSGLLSIDGRAKAAYNAYLIYSRMPVDRRLVMVDGPPGLSGLASSDGHRCSLAVWNKSGSAEDAKLDMQAIPFERGTVRIYRIDAQHASWGDDPKNERLVPVETRKGVRMHDITWSGNIPAGGVVYIEADDDAGESELKRHATAKSLRVLHYYPDRSLKSYAEFDQNTWIARLGMAGEEWADAEVAVVAEDLPPKLRVTMHVDGELRKMDSNSLLGVRLDYRTGGNYTKSVLFHGPCEGKVDLYSTKRWLGHPWGTTRKADEVVAVADCTGFDIPVRAHAPSGWDGRAILTFVLQNAGPTARAKIVVR